MSKSPNQKLKLMHLYLLLMRSSDELHPITIPQMIESLARADIKAERKSIYDDLNGLRSLGVDIQNRKGSSPGWFIGRRDFELPELKLLVDAVQSSRFITKRKSEALIGKLEDLTSSHQAKQLRRQVYVYDRAKTMNESIYYNVDKLHTAIAAQISITFCYFDYDMYHKKVFRRDGRRYNVSPYGLIWNNENYYLVAYDIDKEQMRHYRVDKMCDLILTDRPRLGREHYSDFDLAAYSQKHFGMFSGDEAMVTLRCRAHMAGVVLDRFGHDIIMIPQGNDYFTVTLPIVLSPQFFGWLFGLEDNVTITAPQWAVDSYRERIKTISELY